MTVNRFVPTTIGALYCLLLAAAVASAAQHQHVPPPPPGPSAQAETPDKAGTEIKVGKKGDVEIRVETLVGELRLKPGHYQFQHRAEGPDHFVLFKEVTKGTPYEVKCRLETLDRKASTTTIHLGEEGGSPRVTKVVVRGENVAHLF